MLAFDIFGTVVDWHGSIVRELQTLLALGIKTVAELAEAELQRQLARDAVNAWIFAPQIGTVVRKGLRGTWMNYPIFAHQIAAMWWE